MDARQNLLTQSAKWYS